MRMVSPNKGRVGSLYVGLLFLNLMAIAAVGQQPDTGTISGKVVSAGGAAISGAKVTITNRSTGQTSVIETDAAGKFNSPDLPRDDYSLRAEAKGFISATAVLNLQAGGKVPIDLRLDPEPLPGIVPAHTTENLPASNQSFPEYAQLEPGVQNLDAGVFDPSKSGF
ncbi:MAG: carboxypeptidase regulatory-like domain-containing protein, partial [Acidobacteria bacterium]|nr:carboxypeptidase regulatory-like domain-containing protein [Acidobacteriota bacterium]